MTGAAAERLIYLCDTLTPLLLAMDEESFRAKEHPGKWSRLQIIGHLLDSAANNHQRFVRVQFEDNPEISYNPDLWNAAGHYQSMPPAAVVAFWNLYNRHLAALILRIPAADLQRTCIAGEPVTLAFLIEDYITHLEHHLHQVIDYQ